MRGWKSSDSWQRLAAETPTEMTVTEPESQISPVKEEERRAAPRASRVELALTSNLEKEESVGTREAPDEDQGGAETGKTPKKTQSKHFHWSSIAKQGNAETVLTGFFQDL